MSNPITLPLRRPGPAAVAAVAGGIGWLILGLTENVVDRSQNAVVIAVEAAWIAVQLLILVALLGLARSPALAGPLGRIGIGLALLARLIFLAAEIPVLILGKDETPLVPLAALITAIGMALAGIAGLTSRRWRGWPRLAPLAVGAYPFVLMFPFALVGPEPNPIANACWGVLWALLAFTLRSEGEADSPDQAAQRRGDLAER